MIQRFLETGRLPEAKHIAASLDIALSELTERLNRLSDLHGVVLHPRAPEPWVVHPFSTTPTLHFVEGQRHGWWAPCIWCALGCCATRWRHGSHPYAPWSRVGTRDP